MLRSRSDHARRGYSLKLTVPYPAPAAPRDLNAVTTGRSLPTQRQSVSTQASGLWDEGDVPRNTVYSTVPQINSSSEARFKVIQSAPCLF
jgi:hypothetical protein